MIGRLLASSISLKGQPDASVDPSLAGLVGQTLFRKSAWASQRKRPCSGAGPCMALASLAGFAGADQALTSPELVVQ
jgi:hypothetical protein